MRRDDGLEEREKQQKTLQEMFPSGENTPEHVPNILNSLDIDCIDDSISVSPEIAEKIKIHKELCNGLQNLYATKNADYGDSMHPLFEEYGLTAFLVMFSIKIQRIKSLKDKDRRHYESIEDSLLDLANYALIAVTELRAKNHKEQRDLLDNIEH